MANEEQLEILKRSVEYWNKWRDENLSVDVDLSGANLGRAELTRVNLSGADLRGAILSGADLREANLKGANLREALLYNANLSEINLSEVDLARAILPEANLYQADLTRADLSRANLSETDLREADLSGANLSRAILIQANLTGAILSEALLWGADLSGANLTMADLRKATLAGALFIGTMIDRAKVSGSNVYGISVWDLEGEFDEQKDLSITPSDPLITVDNIKVAQFIYLILNNEEIRDVINTLTSKSVLILGRFSLPERKAILDALKNGLREYNLLPIVFDFDRPLDKDFTETIQTLAGLSYFVIADITNPKSSPLELQATIPDYQIPFVPIIQEGERPFAMMADLQRKYNWVLDTLSYKSIDTLMKALKPAIIDPAIQKHNELRFIKAREPKIRSAEDFLE